MGTMLGIASSAKGMAAAPRSNGVIAPRTSNFCTGAFATAPHFDPYQTT